ncbi:N-acetylneuraminate synthase [Picosynechococcus sp. PCC 7117]|uniref:N-acetylneuraminate synthase n=1 Tax=Picosynechococcus sp. PCC 7117 TaxID=195498 RepID=UPI000810AB88|nr:N-acetylneuraminate synthase [Picosynechococcus sp. PCC 7117]ANV86373.1 N-acetylneuraminate synthase [Picosynechococcus sp. PCC 7117]
MSQYVRIGNREIGQDKPCFIIAEAGVNHNGNIELAHQLVDAAVKAGADAVKFQSFITEELITPEAPKAQYQVETTGKPGSQYEMLKSVELNDDQHKELKTHCDRAGIIYMCTPYENKSVDMLAHLDVAAYKIASTDTTNLPFLRYVASKGRPVILSTGMSNLAEVEEAVNTIKTGGIAEKIVILHCTSEYPAPINEVNLRAMKTLEQAFGFPVGFSDHTTGIGASPWAVAIGACVVEKHFTLDRTLNGPDHRASLEPAELSALVQTIRDVEAALGDGIKQPTASELPNKPMMQKSLVARRHIKAGKIISAEDLVCKRPGFGLQPSWYDRILGKGVTRDISAESYLTLSDIDWS